MYETFKSKGNYRSLIDINELNELEYKILKEKIYKLFSNELIEYIGLMRYYSVSGFEPYRYIEVKTEKHIYESKFFTYNYKFFYETLELVGFNRVEIIKDFMEKVIRNLKIQLFGDDKWL